MPLERTTNSDRFTGQSYLPPSKPTEIASTPVMPYGPPYTFPTPSQPSPNAQVVNLRASASIPQSPNPPLPLPSEIYTYESSSGTGKGNLSTLASPPRADYSHSEFMIDPRGANRARGCAKARHTMMEGIPRANQLISVCHSGHYSAETRLRTRIRPSAGPLRDPNIQTSCGWQNEGGGLCSLPVTHSNCAAHFATVHDIKNVAADVKVLCRWCPLSAEKKVTRHNLLRHLQEVHPCCPRSKKQRS
ncbi:hypothetical protein EDD16DRAFT_1008799 [Pisolithus croceorrhizus]|nr:hypothetical protein EV401DRAFT_666930 [Pisolithus croceorrhizus]KAI6117363.1 hypothetical protein EDD16DRAFT_1008799 [Pisolithus croceorrhizus]